MLEAKFGGFCGSKFSKFLQSVIYGICCAVRGKYQPTSILIDYLQPYSLGNECGPVFWHPLHLDECVLCCTIMLQLVINWK